MVGDPGVPRRSSPAGDVAPQARPPSRRVRRRTRRPSPGDQPGADLCLHPREPHHAVRPLRLLSEWVRDRQLLSMEAGLRKTAGELADVLGLLDRGYVSPGAHADLVVLEWDQLGPGPTRRIRDMPGGGERLVAQEPQ